MEHNKYYKIDKEISNKIQKELRGKVINHICPQCGGTGLVGTCFEEQFECTHCDGKGNYDIQY